MGFTTIIESTATRLLSTSDVDGFIKMSNVAGGIATIPTNATDPIPINTSIMLQRATSGPVSVDIEGGVTLNKSATFTNNIRSTWSKVALLKTDTDTWEITGDLAMNVSPIYASTEDLLLKSDKTFTIFDLTGAPATILDAHVDSPVLVDDVVTLGTHPAGFNCLIVNHSDIAVAWDATGLTILGNADISITGRGEISLLYIDTTNVYLKGETE